MTVRPYVGSKSPPGTVAVVVVVVVLLPLVVVLLLLLLRRKRRGWFVAVEKVLELETNGAAGAAVGYRRHAASGPRRPAALGPARAVQPAACPALDARRVRGQAPLPAWHRPSSTPPTGWW